MKTHQFPFAIIDLTHKITPTMPLWPGSTPLSMNIKHDYDTVGCRVVSYSMSAGTGTHMDAPAHFVKDGKTIEKLTELVVPLCIIDVRYKVEYNNDYVLQPEDIEHWETRHGKIPERSIVVMHTGWYKRWPNLASFLNEDSRGSKHFPGFSLAASEFLLPRSIIGIGIDTFSLDAGIATTFPVHNYLLKHNIYFIECLTNLNQVPEHGAYIGMFALNIEGAPEVPARVVALVPR